MKTSTPQAIKAHAMAFNPQITAADAVKQGLLVPAKIPFLAGYSVVKRENEPFKIVCNANGALAAEVYGHNVKDDTGGAQSLAQLYAAAPELLANLQQMASRAAQVIATWERGNLSGAVNSLRVDLERVNSLIGKVTSNPNYPHPRD